EDGAGVHGWVGLDVPRQPGKSFGAMGNCLIVTAPAETTAKRVDARSIFLIIGWLLFFMDLSALLKDGVAYKGLNLCQVGGTQNSRPDFLYFLVDADQNVTRMAIE